MFVITSDQVGSRSGPDLAGAARERIDLLHGDRLLLPADRTAGDEIQALTDDAGTALSLALELTRGGLWSVGVGCGTVRRPLPAATREATGDAFFAAREAVESAKRSPTRFALRTAAPDPAVPAGAGDRQSTLQQSTADVEAILDLLLSLRARRSPAGWELYDLLESGITQREAAARLGITPASVNGRVKAGGLKIEGRSTAALARLLHTLDEQASMNGTD